MRNHFRIVFGFSVRPEADPSDGAIIYDQVKNPILSLSDIDETKMKTTAERMAAPQDSKKQIR
jgi:hypothetical protein